MVSDDVPKLHYYFGLLAKLVGNLYDIGLNDGSAEEVTVRRVLAALADILSSEYSFVGRYEDQGKTIVIESVFAADRVVGRSFECLEGSIWTAVIEHQTFFAAGLENMDKAARALGIEAAIAAPFVLDDGAKRIIACCNKSISEPYTYERYGSDEGKILEVIGRLLAGQLNRARSVGCEFEKAARIQQELLPKEDPVVENVDLAHMYIPAKTVAGDYYDFIPLGGEKLGILIGDVCGKGIGAALVMVIVRSFIHFLSEKTDKEHSIKEIMFQLNNLIHRCVATGMFVTLVYSVLDTQALSIGYCGAGHLPPLVYRARASHFEETGRESCGLALGIEPNAMYAMHKVDLGQGDIVVFCTDGIFEAKRTCGGPIEEFGMERLQAAVVEAARKSAGEIIQEVRTSLAVWRGKAELEDDASMIVLKVS